MFLQQFKNGQQLTELAVANMVDKYRDEQNFSRGASFKSIVGYGPNGAIPHYTPSSASSLKLDHISTLVIDSGAHYWGELDIIQFFGSEHPTF
jgi:Xaa-Pro aminopeptidase